MIFYFTGTGNSLFAAKTLARDGEEVISVIEAVRSKAFRYALKEGEPLGFVFPVYFYTVSDPVLELVRNLTVENASFVYAVIPCGASIGAAGGFLKSELKKRGLELQRVDASTTSTLRRKWKSSWTPRQKSSRPSSSPSTIARATASRAAPCWGKSGWLLITPAWAREPFMPTRSASAAESAPRSARPGRSKWLTAARPGRKTNASNAAAASTAARSPQSSTGKRQPPAGGT